MYSAKEELIDFSFNRNLETGEFEIEILVKSKVDTVEHELNYSTPYVSIPLHFDYAYIFRLEPTSLYFFKIKKEDLQTFDPEKIEFDVLFNQKKIDKQLRKILDRADVYEDWSAYQILERKIELKNPLTNLIDTFEAAAIEISKESEEESEEE